MPSLRSVLPASTLVDFFKRLIVFLAILLSSFFDCPSGALLPYMQVARHLPVPGANVLNPLKSAISSRLVILTALAEGNKR